MHRYLSACCLMTTTIYFLARRCIMSTTRGLGMAMSSDFGAFFREIRKGLGLSLREFCRQTGFDQGNVSRLERGLLPPPKSEKGLTAYARGLKLKPKSPEWERFMTLAKPPAKPRRGHGHRNWVRAKNLEDWAEMLE